MLAVVLWQRLDGSATTKYVDCAMYGSRTSQVVNLHKTRDPDDLEVIRMRGRMCGELASVNPGGEIAGQQLGNSRTAVEIRISAKHIDGRCGGGGHYCSRRRCCCTCIRGRCCCDGSNRRAAVLRLPVPLPELQMLPPLPPQMPLTGSCSRGRRCSSSCLCRKGRRRHRQ